MLRDPQSGIPLNMQAAEALSARSLNLQPGYLVGAGFDDDAILYDVDLREPVPQGYQPPVIQRLATWFVGYTGHRAGTGRIFNRE